VLLITLPAHTIVLYFFTSAVAMPARKRPRNSAVAPSKRARIAGSSVAAEITDAVCDWDEDGYLVVGGYSELY
jgi:hypothetical protein